MNKTKKILLLTFALVFMLTFIWNEKQGRAINHREMATDVKSSQFSEKEKREIFRDMIIAENRAMSEAYIKYPSDPETGKDNRENLEKKIEYMNELTQKYKKKILEEYNISDEQWKEIAKEAVTEGWELPTQ